MKTACLSITILTLFFAQGCHFRQNNNAKSENTIGVEPALTKVIEADNSESVECINSAIRRNLYYEKMDADAETDWDEKISVFHFWRDISDDEYYFNLPSEEQVSTWKALCEEKNRLDSVSRRYLQGYYANMNQYMTIQDFVEIWYGDGDNQKNDDFTTWRLMQYNSLPFIQPDSEFDKFYVLKNTIQGLLLFEPQSQWELNFYAGLESDFQEYYDRVLVREAIRHSNERTADLLKEEENAWINYHEALNSAFQIIDGSPDGMVGSAWPMAIGGIAYDNAQMRALSMEDFYFALTDSLDYHIAHRKSLIGQYEIERHAQIDNSSVLKEYLRFMDFFKDESFFEPEYSYSVSELRSVLEDEMKAWQGWMLSRDKVSSTLTGLCKDCYDNATNNIRRHKLIMLKNRYQGFGITSKTTLDCLLPYSCEDPDIDLFSFEEKWNSI